MATSVSVSVSVSGTVHGCLKYHGNNSLHNIYSANQGLRIELTQNRGTSFSNEGPFIPLEAPLDPNCLPGSLGISPYKPGEMSLFFKAGNMAVRMGDFMMICFLSIEQNT
jgi:hypothetical protein